MPFGWESQSQFIAYFAPQIKDAEKLADVANFPNDMRPLTGLKIKRLDVKGPFAPSNQYLVVPNRPIKSREIDGQVVLDNGLPFASPVVQCYSKDPGDVETAITYEVTTQSRKIVLYNLRPWNLPFEFRKLVIEKDNEVKWWDPAKYPNHKNLATLDISEALVYLNIGKSSSVIYKLYEAMDPSKGGEKDFIKAVKKALISIIEEASEASGLPVKEEISRLSKEFPAVSYDFILGKIKDSKDLKEIKSKLKRATQKRKSVRFWSETGELLKTFTSTKLAAQALGRSTLAIYYGIKNGSPYRQHGKKYYFSTGDSLPVGIPELAQTHLESEALHALIFETYNISMTSLCGQVLSGKLKRLTNSAIAETLNITESEVSKLYEIGTNIMRTMNNKAPLPRTTTVKMSMDDAPYFDSNINLTTPFTKNNTVIDNLFS